MANRVREWLFHAELDWDTACLLATRHGYQGHSLICYHCQQAAEKYLKAVIQSTGGVARKSHELPALAKLIPDFPAELLQLVDDLNPMGTSLRYPGILTSETMALSALQHITRLRTWVYTYLRETPPDLFSPPDFL